MRCVIGGFCYQTKKVEQYDFRVSSQNSASLRGGVCVGNSYENVQDSQGRAAFLKCIVKRQNLAPVVSTINLDQDAF